MESMIGQKLLFSSKNNLEYIKEQASNAERDGITTSAHMLTSNLGHKMKKNFSSFTIKPMATAGKISPNFLLDGIFTFI